jgi:hypothetical protein
MRVLLQQAVLYYNHLINLFLNFHEGDFKLDIFLFLKLCFMVCCIFGKITLLFYKNLSEILSEKIFILSTSVYFYLFVSNLVNVWGSKHNLFLQYFC